MLDSKPVPTLSGDGWVTSTPLKADYLMSYFFLSEYSRTYLYHGQIASFTYLLQQHKDDMSKLSYNTEQVLKRLFGAYFPKVDVEVTTKQLEGSKWAITLVVVVTDVEGKEFSVAKLADVLDSKLVKVQQLNNYGADT